jgi:hypothetical protein
MVALIRIAGMATAACIALTEQIHTATNSMASYMAYMLEILVKSLVGRAATILQEL